MRHVILCQHASTAARGDGWTAGYARSGTDAPRIFEASPKMVSSRCEKERQKCTHASTLKETHTAIFGVMRGSRAGWIFGCGLRKTTSIRNELVFLEGTVVVGFGLVRISWIGIA